MDTNHKITASSLPMTTAVSQERLLNGLRQEFKPLLRLAIPIVMAEIGWMFMGIVDTIMLGRLPNSAVAIGASSLGSNLFYTISIFGGGLFLGLDTLVSQAFGRKDLESANRTLINAVYLHLMLAPVLMAFAWLWPPLLRAMGIQNEIMQTMVPFLNALNWGMLPLLFYFVARRYLQSVNIVKPITFAMISANLVNALFNWIFIFGHWGSPAFGAAGSGWSTCLARIYMALVLLGAILYYDRKHGLGVRSASRELDFKLIGKMLALGLPAASQILLEIGVFSVVAALCAKLGPVPLAGHQIALTAAAFSYMIPLGISSAAVVRVGNEIGANNPHRARRAGWVAILLGAAVMSCAALVFVTLSKPIARIFSPDPAVVRMGAALLLIAAAFELFDGLQTVATGALRGAGDTRSAMIANLVAYWLIGLPVGWVLCFRFGWGAQGLWTGLCLGLILIGCYLLWVWNERSRVHSY